MIIVTALDEQHDLIYVNASFWMKYDKAQKWHGHGEIQN